MGVDDHDIIDDSYWIPLGTEGLVLKLNTIIISRAD